MLPALLCLLPQGPSNSMHGGVPAPPPHPHPGLPPRPRPYTILLHNMQVLYTVDSRCGWGGGGVCGWGGGRRRGLGVGGRCGWEGGGHVDEGACHPPTHCLLGHEGCDCRSPSIPVSQYLQVSDCICRYPSIPVSAGVCDCVCLHVSQYPAPPPPHAVFGKAKGCGHCAG